ncbi:serine/threonine protein kinase (plasmid) [Embleya sp. NBC_00888]|uniref:serine/threonine-protein kinase n=1 Tax=Embleya sp. NBC_00888 TaxID=2975960 RepID=UPI002F90FC55|nr:serine/threonine protein kinase [Embleya sp. NBC_00888]
MVPLSGRGLVAVRVLAGRYELVAFVGRGGMGEVWEGRDRVIERRVAVKLVPHDRNETSGAELFLREARTAGTLNHPGVVTVHDFGRDTTDGSLFLVMEFVDGRDLASVLREDGPPPVAGAVEWAAQAAAALARAHDAGIVHRDLKPANLMLTADGRVKVLDFGIARFMEASNKSSRIMGTWAYMAPERFDEHAADARSDLYSLGCVLNELLTGEPPFDATGPVSMMNAHLRREPVPPGDTRDGVPRELDDLVLELLAKDPERRPATAVEAHDRLRGMGRIPSGATTLTTRPPRRTQLPDRRPPRARAEETDVDPRPGTGTTPPTWQPSADGTFDIAWTGREPLSAYTDDETGHRRDLSPRTWTTLAVITFLATAACMGLPLLLDSDAIAVWLTLGCFVMSAWMGTTARAADAIRTARITRPYPDRTGWALHVGPHYLVTTGVTGRREFTWDRISRVTIEQIAGAGPHKYTGIVLKHKPGVTPPATKVPPGWPYPHSSSIRWGLGRHFPICVLGPMTQQQRTRLTDALARYGGERWDGN